MKTNDAALVAKIEEYLQAHLQEHRYQHVLGVREVAVDLAKRYQAAVYKANLAALLHDCAKWMSVPQLHEAVQRYGVQLDEIEQRNASLLHAPVGAAMAKAEFGVDDPEVLSAVQKHTTGGADMTCMDKIIYVADFSEPTRTYEEAKRVRELAYHNLDGAVFEVSLYKIQHLLEKRMPIHPNTIGAYNQALQAASYQPEQRGLGVRG